jgi:hypothetical protein
MDVTFRDFAAAILRDDLDAAGGVLQALLGVDADGGRAAAVHFQAQMKAGGPAFMGKAMGLRTAVTAGTDDEIGALIGECFGLSGSSLAASVATLRARYA